MNSVKSIAVTSTLISLLGCQSKDLAFNPAYRVGSNSGAKDSAPAQTISQVLKEANDSFT